MDRPLQHVTTPYGDIAYTETGSGPAALFVHGVFMNGFLWRHVVDRVGEARRCISIDLPGHGGTRALPDVELSFRTQAEVLEAVCAALDLDQVDLVANDSGGAIAQIFAARHPDRIRSFTLTNCDVHDNWPPEAIGPIREIVDRGEIGAFGAQLLGDIDTARSVFSIAYEHPERLSEETVRTYLGPLFASPESVRALERWFEGAHDCAQTVEVEPLLRELTAPTLVVWGTDDVFFPLQWAYWLRDTIPGCTTVVELEGAKLFFPEERPDELAVALLRHWGVDPS
jgi:pimeloyl-ACP methyl ester carboxylesterase